MGNEESALDLFEVVEQIGNPAMRETLRSFAKSVAERSKQEAEEKKEIAKVIQFPLPFPVETRPASNDLIRSALFAAVQGKDRQHFSDYVQLASIGDKEIWYKGDQFNQDDHDAFMQMIFMAQHKPLGEDVKVSFRSFVAGLGKGYGSDTREAVAQSVDRLISGTVKLINKRAGLNYIGHLVHDGMVPSDQQHLPRLERDLTYQINPKLAPYFSRSAFTLIDWTQRLKLKRQELAKWIHLWLASNAEYYPTKVETIREKCGSQTAELYKFRQMLRSALKALENSGVIGVWYIEKGSDLLYIDTKPSQSQRKHLGKAKRRRQR